MQQTPQPPAAPQAATTIEVPTTRADLDAIVMLRSELRDQLQSLNSRRTEIIAESRVTGDRGTSQRVAALDARIASLEQRIQAADEAVTTGIARGLGMSSPRTVVTVPPMPMRFGSGMDVGRTVGSIVAANTATLAILAVVFMTYVRRRVRGGDAPAIAEQSRRLDQLQAAVDTMAVEVERISEGQRYVTKLLSDRLPASTGPKS